VISDLTESVESMHSFVVVPDRPHSPQLISPADLTCDKSVDAIMPQFYYGLINDDPKKVEQL
jgi:hypothetical protein